MRPRKSVEADDLLFVLIDPTAHRAYNDRTTVGVVAFGYCRPGEWEGISAMAKEAGLTPVHQPAGEVHRWARDNMDVLPAKPVRLLVHDPEFGDFEAAENYFESGGEWS